ncbi:MAG: hypothetical protein U5J63_16070 [Fodinibius sp.]|nr:hypothetical protein [Fodinibius sp.]
MKRFRKFIIAAVLAVTSLAVLGLVRNPDIYFLIKKNFTIFSEVYREVSLNYVDRVNPEKLMRKGINAIHISKLLIIDFLLSGSNLGIAHRH